MADHPDAEAPGKTPVESREGWLCRHHGVPTDFSPLGQIFWSPSDLTTSPDAEGNRMIECRNISDSEEARLIYRVNRLLAKARLPIP